MPASPQWPSTPMMPVYMPSNRGPKIHAILLGLALFVGLVATHTAMLLPFPGSGGSSNPDIAAYLITIRALAVVSLAAMDAGVAFAVTIAFWGLSRPDLPDSSRRGQFLFATVFLGIWLIFSTLSLSVLSIILR